MWSKISCKLKKKNIYAVTQEFFFVFFRASHWICKVLGNFMAQIQICLSLHELGFILTQLIQTNSLDTAKSKMVAPNLLLLIC